MILRAHLCNLQLFQRLQNKKHLRKDRNWDIDDEGEDRERGDEGDISNVNF